MTLARRTSKAPGRRGLRRRRRHPPADGRRAPHPRDPARPDRRGRRPGARAWGSGPPSACCVQHPGTSGAVRDLRPLIAAAKERGAVVAVAADLLALTLLESPGELGADVAVGSSQRFGVPLGLRRPARRVHGRPQGPRAQHARPPGRRERRRRRRPRDAPGAADPRAAHPPREGHEQHLHRAGPARGDGRRVRGAPRPRGPRDHRPPHPPQRRRPRRRPARRGRRARARAVLRHPHRERPRPGRGGRGRRPPARRRAAPRRRRHPRHQHRRDDDPRPPVRGGGGVRRRRARLGRPRRAERRRAARGPAAHHAVPHARGLPHPPQRDLDAALPAPAVRQGPRPRPDDDPARLLHDEAQRDHRDGAGDLAGVRRAAPVHRPEPRAGLPHAW